MKKLLYILIISSVIVQTGCKKSFNELEANPNKPTSVPASLLFNGVLNSMYEGPDGSYEKWDQYFLENYDYYGDNRYDFGSGPDFYSTLNNVVKMEEAAVRDGNDATLNPYAAMGKFLRAYYFTKMSLAMGDMPVSEALQGSANFTPVYDPQKNVFKQALTWLDEANADITKLIADNNTTLAGDIYLGNKLSEWQKVVNAFHLRLLIHLSKKANDADLNVKAAFAAIVADPAKYPLMLSADDNLEYIYTHPTNDYPSNPDSYGFNALRKNTSKTYVGLLTQLKDPRVFVTTEPAAKLVTNGADPSSFAAFVGADPGEAIGDMYAKANAGEYSLIGRRRYYETYAAEPTIIIGYPEQCFAIAEAINRGWLASGPLGNAEAYYRAGILTSMAFYSIPDAGTFTQYVYKSGSPGKADVVYEQHTITSSLTNYYNQALVKYIGNTADGLKQILQQKYLAMFRHSGLEAYYQYRRTGVPTFTTGAGTGNSARIPTRFQYFNSEKSANTSNYQKALDDQYGGNDDINGLMWILKD